MTTTTADALLAAVLARPGDDAPRLIYADRLEERDGPGDAERAEFVRVQCELEGPLFLSWDDLRAASACTTAVDPKIARLRRRERELLKAHYLDWLPRLIPGEQVIGGPDDTGCCVVAPFEGVWFRRGFVEEVACPLEAWAGWACRRCGGKARGVPSPKGGWITCPDCLGTAAIQGTGYGQFGTGRVSGVGAALVACQPITTVRVTDREPYFNTGRDWVWVSDAIHDGWGKATLPAAVFALLRGGKLSPLGTARYYSTEAAALADLSTALILFVKGGGA